MRAAGLVSLVGAGPGHPDYLTQKAVRRLREADLVLYEALVDPAVLAIAEHAEWVDVGKRAGRLQTSQVAIQQSLVDAGSKGRRVVRLKGGDPFVFGRGGEEALALQDAGIPFEVVPGVSSAIAAPALAGIPVTHRGVASAFVVVTTADKAVATAVIAALPPGLVTVVAMMSLGNRADLVTQLLDRGWPAGTSAALLLGAATSRQWTWRGPLGALAACEPPAGSADAPGTIVVGAVASLDLSLVHGEWPPIAVAPSVAEEFAP
jgi:uroporphyrin-III C-methyltransferase / precorrin-2 dehydrogenase / sirohydrochlorin ferrochelatase